MQIFTLFKFTFALKTRKLLVSSVALNQYCIYSTSVRDTFIAIE